MSDKNLTPQQRWQKNNPETVRKSKAEYDKKNPVWAFRPTPELQEWLEKERRNDAKGNPETNSSVVIRKLEKLMKMEY